MSKIRSYKGFYPVIVSLTKEVRVCSKKYGCIAASIYIMSQSDFNAEVDYFLNQHTIG